MSQTSFIYTCPGCAQKVKAKMPQKGGVYRLTCPHCGKVARVNLPGLDGPDAAPVPPVPPSAAPVPPVPPAAPGVPGAPFPPAAPAAAAPKAAPTVPPPLNRKPDAGNRRARLVQLGTIANTPHQLKMGTNVIGRWDPNAQSDINIKNDATMSRRSVEIDVTFNEASGYRYQLKVLKAANPVYYNQRPVDPRFDQIFLNFGDIIRLGETEFRLDPQ